MFDTFEKCGSWRWHFLRFRLSSLKHQTSNTNNHVLRNQHLWQFEQLIRLNWRLFVARNTISLNMHRKYPFTNYQGDMESKSERQSMKLYACVSVIVYTLFWRLWNSLNLQKYLNHWHHLKLRKRNTFSPIFYENKPSEMICIFKAYQIYDSTQNNNIAF